MCNEVTYSAEKRANRVNNACFCIVDGDLEYICGGSIVAYSGVDAETGGETVEDSHNGGGVLFGEKYRPPYYISRGTQGYVSIYIFLLHIYCLLSKVYRLEDRGNSCNLTRPWPQHAGWADYYYYDY